MPARSFTFRLSSEGVTQLERDLTSLGAQGRKVFEDLKNAAPGLANGLNNAAAAAAKARAEIDRTRRSSASMAEGLVIAKEAAAVFGVSLGIGALIQYSREVVRTVGDLKSMAEQVGVSTRALQVYEYAARQTNVSQETLQSGVSQLTRLIGEAASGNKTAADLFDRLGISIKNAGKVRDTESIFRDIANRIQQSADATQQATIANEAFGKSGQKFLPMLKAGAEGIDEFGARADKFGQIIGDQVIDDFDKSAAKWEEWGRRITVVSANVIDWMGRTADAVKFGGGQQAEVYIRQQLQSQIAGLEDDLKEVEIAHAQGKWGIELYSDEQYRADKARIDQQLADAKSKLDELSPHAADSSLIKPGRLGPGYKFVLPPAVDPSLQASLDQISILRQTAGMSPARRAIEQAALTAKLSASRSSDAFVSGHAQEFGDNARTAAILKQNQAISDQNTQIELNTSLTVAAGEAWLKSEAEGKAADALRDASLKELQTGYDKTKAAAQAMEAAAADAIERGAQQLQDLQRMAADQEKLVAAALQGTGIEHGEQLRQKIDDATRDLRTALANTTDPQKIDDLIEEIDAISAALTRADEAASNLSIAHAIQAQQGDISLLQAQLGLIGATNREREIELADIQARLELSDQNVAATSAEGAAYIENARAIANMNAELERQQAIAQELPDFFSQAFDRIGSAITEAFAQGKKSMVDFRDLGRSVVSELIQEFVKLSLLNPLKNWLFNTELPTFSDVAAHVAGASTQNIAASGGGMDITTTAGGGNAGGAFGGTGSGFSLSSLSGLFNGSILGNIFNPVQESAALASGAPPVGGLQDASIFSNLNWAGGGISAVLGALPQILSGDVKGGLITGGLTGAGFLVGGPIGAAIGGLVGNLIGGLFKKKPKWKNYKAAQGAVLGFDDSGSLGVDSSFGYGHRISGSAADGAKLGNVVSDAFNDFMTDTGASFAPDLQGQVNEIYKIAKKGKKTKDELHEFRGWFGGQYLGAAPTAEELIPLFLSGALAVGSQQGKVSGVSQTTQTIFKNMFAANGNKGVSSQDDIQKALDYSKFYDRLDEIRTPAQGAADALKDLEKAMKSAASQAEDYGLDVAKIPEIFKANFTDSIADQILALKDPAALAQKQLDISHAAMVAQAEKLGVDLAQVEELYSLQRQQIVEQGLQGVNTSFRQFFDELTLGDASTLSPSDQFAAAQGRYNDVVASGSQTDFIGAAQNYLTAARAQFASGPQYAAIYADVLAKVRQYGNIPGFASGGDHAGGLAYVHQNELIATGPARIFNAAQTSKILGAANDNGVARLGKVLTGIAQQQNGQIVSLVGVLQKQNAALHAELSGLRKTIGRQNDYDRVSRK